MKIVTVCSMSLTAIFSEGYGDYGWQFLRNRRHSQRNCQEEPTMELRTTMADIVNASIPFPARTERKTAIISIWLLKASSARASCLRQAGYGRTRPLGSRGFSRMGSDFVESVKEGEQVLHFLTNMRRVNINVTNFD